MSLMASPGRDPDPAPAPEGVVPARRGKRLKRNDAREAPGNQS